MAALAEQIAERWSTPAPAPEFSTGEIRILNHLRIVGLRCRASRRTDLFEACALLSLDRKLAESAHAEVLMRGLVQALGRPPLFFQPGEKQLSFDESWLLRMLQAARHGDDSSITFLLRSRLPLHAQRNVGFLIHQISERFSLL